MEEALDSTLGKKDFHNWLKGAMSVLFAKEGLSEFVQTEITDFQKDLINSVITLNGIAPGTLCASCSTANVLNCPTANFCSKGKRCNKHDKTAPEKTPNIQCSNNLCNGIKDGIRNQHIYNQPSWKNSDATKWCVDAFEVAKCFLPPDGYSSKSSLADIDFNGMMSIIINNKRFQNKMTTQLNTQHNTFSKAREIINQTIRHSGTNELSDLQLSQCIDALRDVLVDSKFLLHDQHAQNAVKKLNQLQNNTLTISSGDITRAMQDNIRDCHTQQQQKAVKAFEEYLQSSVVALELKKCAALDEIRKTADDKKQELLQLSQQQHTHNDDGAENKISLFTRLRNKLTSKEDRLRLGPSYTDGRCPIGCFILKLPSYWKNRGNCVIKVDITGNNTAECIKVLVNELWSSSDVSIGRDATARGPASLKITNVYRIENAELFQKYHEKRQKMVRKKSHVHQFPSLKSAAISTTKIIRNNKKLRNSHLNEIIPGINEHFLFHGTKPQNVDSIWMAGLSIEYSGRTVYGKGIYMSENPTKSDQYTGQQFSKQMFLCRVCLGEMYVLKTMPSEFYDTPPCKEPTCQQWNCQTHKYRFDSVVADIPKYRFREFVVQRDYWTYPEYLIIYKHIYSDS